MDITISQIKQVLLDKGVKYLYHANTVATSVTFLSNGGVLSRGAVEEKGLFQTPQRSDEMDKQLGVFFDIFFDSADIHARANDLNAYGPVTFVYSIDVLDALGDHEVKITRDNPIRWDDTMGEEKRYFTKLISLQTAYQKGAFKQHLTICNIHEPLPFSPYLVKIMIDNPNIPNTTYFDEAVDQINSLLKQGEIKAPLEIRQCSEHCKCQEKYKNYSHEFIYNKFKIR